MTTQVDEKTAVIRTSDRMTFRSCRRRWNWQSHLRERLTPKITAVPLWLGTGIHYALEDYYGYKNFEYPSYALAAYADACQTQATAEKIDIPDWSDEIEMGKDMLVYFTDYWLKAHGRSGLKTFIHNGTPQVEVNFIVPIPLDIKALYPDSPYDKAVYSGTIDRIIEDDDGLLWLVDYKTAKSLKTTHIENDSQITSYCWVASHLYDRPVGGMIYWQFLKTSPIPPRVVAKGVSVAKSNMRTSHPLYKEQLIKVYGSLEDTPVANMNFLNDLLLTESPERDAYIRQDRIYKNAHSIHAEGEKILMETADMLDPNLNIYPNPTFTCASMCAMYEPCISQDDGTDMDEQLSMGFVKQTERDSWRRYLLTPLTSSGQYDVNTDMRMT